MIFLQYLFLLILIVGLLFLFYKSSRCTVLEIVQYLDSTKIYVVNATCSEGLPHTSDKNTIVMPLDAWNSEHRERTLRHEMVHIKQRRGLELWYTFYRTHWNYERSVLPPELDARSIRPNPDTLDSPFMLWRGRYMFLPVYTDAHTLQHAKVQVYDIINRKFTDIPPEWTAFFSPQVHQYEHPHEISAEYLTVRRSTPAAEKLYLFYNQNF